ncbi:MAG: aminotransferase class III-fold pyridoxal phosphate-dependent enzyme [Planctomycetota bacterium]
MAFNTVKRSLVNLVGDEFVRASCRAREAITGEPAEKLFDIASKPIDFYPVAMQRKLAQRLDLTGKRICEGLNGSASGASTKSYNAATTTAAAPLSGFGYYRIGEDGRQYLLSKSEHYHAPLGHSFPGYKLLDAARKLGIPNATHNNTRGHITRLLEMELIRTANGIAKDDAETLKALIASNSPGSLNRVLNLETGSLAVEAALKMILARFYRSESRFDAPKYAGKTPVILVIGSNDGETRQANYHGTTMLTQTLRGMWPELSDMMEKAGILIVRAVRPNRIEDIESAIREYETDKTKIAGFFHEIVMMNYGGLLLTPDYLRTAYQLCADHDIATVDDEIQSCMWHHEMYMFREWGLKPNFVAIGKGFPGGEYAASKLLFSSEFDSLPQFGALVTNGQEELASLTYLITMEWAAANADKTRAVGDDFEKKCHRLQKQHKDKISGVQGKRHLIALEFRKIDEAVTFAKAVGDSGCDISVHTYKAACPPAALLKLPLTADKAVVDFVIQRMSEVL